MAVPCRHIGVCGRVAARPPDRQCGSLRQKAQCSAIFGRFAFPTNVLCVARCELSPENGRFRAEKQRRLQRGVERDDNGQAGEARKHFDEWREGVGR